MSTRRIEVVDQYPIEDALPDPPKIHDMQHHRQLRRIDSALDSYYADRPDVLVSGGGYLRRHARNDAEQLAPDCVVAFGVDPDAIVDRNGYVISEVGKPPDFVLEVASKSTSRRDYTVKRDAYAGYEVAEYWRSDETGGRYHDAPLGGDRLVDGVYVPIPLHRTPGGVIWGHSEVLGLDVCWDRGMTRFRDPATGEYLPDNREMKENRNAERADRLIAEAQRGIVETQRDEERSRRLAAEAELSRLHERLRQAGLEE